MLGPLDMFSIGIGPSSSHTIGPMRAAYNFVSLLAKLQLLIKVTRIEANLFGSLALTGEGHGTVIAVLNGLAGEEAKTVDPKQFIQLQDTTKQTGHIMLLKHHQCKIAIANDIILHKEQFLPQHANGMRFVAYDQFGLVLLSREYFSIGGGFVLDQDEIKNYGEEVIDSDTVSPYPFKTSQQLLNLCKQHRMSIAELVSKNELVKMSPAKLRHDALEIIEVMHDSVIRGITTGGILPGGLNVKRRAPELYAKLNTTEINTNSEKQRLMAMAFAIAVNEENASFNRIVTAPTNGSAGTIPGVLEYYRRFGKNVTDDHLVAFILTAGTIGMLYKYGASISAAEVGCQGEIGVSCSMASGALTAVMGGSLIQVEKAAEIAMEHSLGMTCDPIAGLVQIPCIERNGVAASRAIDITGLALLETDPGKISLDEVIKTMMLTGQDMSVRYKETSLGGLAVNFVTC